jgi:ribA/ribD-fused uncharacterized protein
MKPEDFGYVVKNNICLFQKGPISQWYGAFHNQTGSFTAPLPEVLVYCCGEESYDMVYELYRGNKYIPFNCCEQFMMACKALVFNDCQIFRAIMGVTQPSAQKDFGRRVKNYSDERWNKYKEKIVYQANLYKFHQNPDLKEFLCSFHPFTIFAEAAPWDKIWGIGLAPENPDALDINKWQGQNLLGKAIMKVRAIYV